MAATGGLFEFPLLATALVENLTERCLCDLSHPRILHWTIDIPRLPVVVTDADCPFSYGPGMTIAGRVLPAPQA